MSNQIETDDLFESINQGVPNTNCFGYVLYKLGVDDSDNDISEFFNVKDEEGLFDRVDSYNEADAIVIKLKYNNVLPYVHMVYIDKEKNRLLHKINFGLPVKVTSMEELEVIYPRDTYIYVFLKLKR